MVPPHAHGVGQIYIIDTQKISRRATRTTLRYFIHRNIGCGGFISHAAHGSPLSRRWPQQVDTNTKAIIARLGVATKLFRHPNGWDTQEESCIPSRPHRCSRTLCLFEGLRSLERRLDCSRIGCARILIRKHDTDTPVRRPGPCTAFGIFVCLHGGPNCHTGSRGSNAVERTRLGTLLYRRIYSSWLRNSNGGNRRGSWNRILKTDAPCSQNGSGW